MRSFVHLLVILAVLLVVCPSVKANEKRFGYCQTQNGGTRVINCTITVYLTGTLTKPDQIYSDNLGTPIGNPFTASNTTGLWSFYAPNGRYDVQFSGGSPTISPAYTLSDYLFLDIGTLGQSINFSGDILPANDGQNLGNSGNRWNLFADSISWYAATTFPALLVHSNTASRTYTFPDASGTLPLPTLSQTWTAAQSFSSINNVIYADAQTGADACLQIAASIALLPSTGGVVNALAYRGAQTCSVNPLASATKPILLLLGAADFQTNVQWQTPGSQSNIIVRGIGPQATSVSATSSFPNNSSGGATCTARIGANTGFTDNTRFENLTINAKGGDGNSCSFYSNNMNEGSGLRDVVPRNWRQYGIHVQSGATTSADFTLEHINSGPSTAATGTHIFIDGTGDKISLFDVTCANNTASALVDCIRISNTAGTLVSIRSLHAEQVTNGVTIVGGSATVDDFSGAANVTNAIQIAPGAFFSGRNISRATGMNTIIDNNYSRTLTDSIIQFYNSNPTVSAWIDQSTGFNVANSLVFAPTLFANLGTPASGTFRFCSDCTVTNPCAGGGTGALAKRLGAIWVCN